MQLGNALMRRTDYAAAADAYGRAAEINTDNVQSRYWLALAYLAFDQCAEAQTPLEEAVSLASEDPIIKQALTRAYAICPTTTPDQLLAALDNANGLYQAYPGLQTSVTLAMVLAAMGEFDEAMEYQRQAMFEGLKLGDEATMSRLKAMLDDYGAGKPAQHAWPPESDVYVPPRMARPQTPSAPGQEGGDSG